MLIKVIDGEFSVCKVRSLDGVDISKPFTFTCVTDEEISAVCKTENISFEVDFIEKEDGWRAFRIDEILDFSLVGILAKISEILAKNSIGIFAVSTYNTDYILVKRKDFERAISSLTNNGYTVER